MAAASVTVPSLLQISPICSGIKSRSSSKDATTSAVSFSARTAYTSLSSVFPSVFHRRNNSCCSKLHAKSARNVVRAEARPEEEARQFGAHEALKEASFDLKLPRRRMLAEFTCNVCEHRTQRLINPEAYRRGTVFVQCAGCETYHQLVDNLKLIEEFDFRKENGSPGE